MRKYQILNILLTLQTLAFSQNMNNIQMPQILNENARTTIRIPDILGYKTLKCDFHMHTVFSDGIVWPTVRVEEAWQEGLDAIAITDHIEKNPSKKFVGGDDNSAYEIALPLAKEKDIILIHAGEITRGMPPGHFNALFIDDTQKLDVANWHDAFAEAKKQGAFIMWNHPGWKAQQPDSCRWWPEHTELYNNGMLHAVEVFNEAEWYPIALSWCIEKNLAPIANSDIHGITAGMYNLGEYHRPLTLVFAKDRSEEALKEALFAKRTVAWFGNNLAGEELFLSEIFKAAIGVKLLQKKDKTEVYLLTNNSDIPVLLRSAKTNLTIPGNSEMMVTIKEGENKFGVDNFFIDGTRRLEVVISEN